MTQFLDRRSFVKTATAKSADSKGVLMVLDGDQFNEITKRFGVIGNEMAVQRIEEVVSECVRKDDIVSHLEGDRFVVFAHNVSMAEGQRIAERIRQTVADLSFEPQRGVRQKITVSIGAVIVSPRSDAEKMIELADECLVHAKQNGRNTVVMKTYFKRTSEMAVAA